MVIWGFFTNLHVAPMWFGSVITLGVEQLIMLSVVYLRTLTLDSMQNAGTFMNNETVKISWISAKDSFFKARGAHTRAELMDYRKTWLNRYILRAYFNKIMGRSTPSLSCTGISPKMKEDCSMSGMSKEDLKARVAEFVGSGFDLEDKADVAYLTFEYDKLVTEAYLAEL